MANKTTRLRNAQVPRNITYDLTPQVDGHRQTFTLPEKVWPQDRHFLLFNGQEYRNEKNHIFYSISSDGMTLTTLLDYPPTPGPKFVLQFIKTENAEGTGAFATQDYANQTAASSKTAAVAESKTYTDTKAATKQDTLVSGVNVKTVNNMSIVGSGNIDVGGAAGVSSVNGMTGDVTLDAEDVGALPEDTEIPSKTSDLTNDSNFQNATQVDAKVAVETAARQAAITAVEAEIPDVIDNVSSTSTTDALSANQGNALNTRINNIESRGRYLSTWNCTTGQPGTQPSTLPYSYKTGDYYIVSTVGTTNYKPNGASYTGSASTTTETGTVAKNDTYLYDGTTWTLVHTEIPTIAIDDELSTTSRNPVENRIVTGAINNKADQSTTYTKTEVDTSLATKANQATTYTKTEVDTALATKQSTLTAGDNISISNNTISATDTTYDDFTGATSSAAGEAGLVPAPAIADKDKYLKGDGTWEEVQAGPTVVQSTGTSTTDVMSQNATGKMIFVHPENASTGSAIKIGSIDQEYSPDYFRDGDIAIGQEITSATKTWGYGIAIGKGCYASDSGVIIGEKAGPRGYAKSNSSICIGDYAILPDPGFRSIVIGDAVTAGGGGRQVVIGHNATVTGTHNGIISLGAYSGSGITATGMMDIGSSLTTHGYNSSNYRLLTGLYDPQDDHDAANKQFVVSYAAINGAGAPTSSTEAKYIGQLYYDTTNNAMYYCSAISEGTYTWLTLGGGPAVVQSTGTSTTDVMSQNATTSMVYVDPASKQKIQIGGNANASGVSSIAVGANTISNNSQSTALGYQSKARGKESVAIGPGALATGEDSISIGDGSSASGKGSIALGNKSSATLQGEINIGSTNTSYGYNSTNYRLLTGVHDGQSAHDAATKGQLDTALASKQNNLTAGANITIDANNEISADVPSVVQSSGSSTDDVMSQNAVTSITSALDTRITNLQSIGRFLAIWDCATGLPTSNPPSTPYTYKTGDYYRVGNVDATTNYMPNGPSYTGSASSAIYTGTGLTIGAVFYYDGTTWNLQASGGGGTVQDVQVNGVSVLSGGIANVPVPTVVQSTGTSTTDVMSQNAATGMIFSDTDTRNNIRVGKNVTGTGNRTIAIGQNITANAGTSVFIGYENSYSFAGASDCTAIGSWARTPNFTGGTAIGSNTYVASSMGTAIGYYAAINNSDHHHSVALGDYSTVTAKGQVSIGGSELGTNGYNNSQYRLLSNVYDPQNDHDAATKGYVDTHGNVQSDWNAAAGSSSEILNKPDNFAFIAESGTAETPTPWVDTSEIVDGAVTASKVDFSTLSMIDVSGNYGDSDCSANSIITLDVEKAKTGSKLSLSKNKIVIGAGVTKVIISASVFYHKLSGGQNYGWFDVVKNGSEIGVSAIANVIYGDYGTATTGLRIVSVQEGDVLSLLNHELNMVRGRSTSLTVIALA